jgi:hypothetical protein
MHDHRAPGDVARRENVRGVGTQVPVHLDVPAPVRLHAGLAKVQPGGGGVPSGRDHRQRGLEALLAIVGAADEPHAGRAALEAVNRPGVLEDLDADRAQRGPDGFRDFVVLAHQDAWTDLDEMDVRAERVED